MVPSGVTRVTANKLYGGILLLFLCACAWLDKTSAQQPNPPAVSQRASAVASPMRISGQALRPPLTPADMRKESWRQAMLQPADAQTGCFTATYPNKVWKAVPCVSAPNHPFADPKKSPGGLHPQDVGDVHGDYQMQSTGNIGSAEGSFPEVYYLTSETGSGSGASNDWSLQLNTNRWKSGACIASTTNGSCQGWQQYVYSNSGDVGNLLIQTWLIDFSATCPYGWTKYGDTNCWRNSLSISVPIQALADLSKLSLQGQAVQGGLDTITLSTPGGMYTMSTSDNFVGLGGAWNTAEFNIFGNAGGAKASFNQGVLLSVRVLETDNTANLDSCSGGSTTGETTNLTLTSWCTPQGGTERGIQFAEAYPPVITGVGPNTGTADGGTQVTVYGTGFSRYMEAFFGSFDEDISPNCQPTQCVFHTPKGASTVTVDITVANMSPTFGLQGAFSTPTSADQFTYESFPGGLLQPSQGSQAGGDAVSIVGHDLNTAPGGTIVLFDLNGVLTAPDNLVCSSTTLCTMKTPLWPDATAGQVAPVSITVNGRTSSPGGFTYGTAEPSPPPESCDTCIQNGGHCVKQPNGKLKCVGQH